MDETMDNQQVKDTDLAWLAGIIDGEGNISLICRKSRGGIYRPFIVITNTDIRILEKCQNIGHQLGINFYIYKRQIKDRQKHKLAYNALTQKMGHVVKLIPYLLPYLIAKKDQAQILLEFSLYRLENLRSHKHDWNKENLWYQKIKNLNQKGPNSSETIRQPLTREDIVQSK